MNKPRVSEKAKTFLIQFILNIVLVVFGVCTIGSSYGVESKGEEQSGEKEGITSIETSRVQLLVNKLTSSNDTSNVGGINAVNIIINKAEELYPGLEKSKILEIGSGYGSAANYIYNIGFKNIQGIDIDKAALEYARSHYPEVKFDEVNALKTTKFFEEDTFPFIYMINVYSDIYDHALLIQKTKSICTEGGIIAIFDYGFVKTSEPVALTFSNGHQIRAIKLDDLELFFRIVKMEKLAVIDVSGIYEEWYQKLIDNIVMKRSLLVATNEFTEAEITFIEKYFRKMLALFKEKKVTGFLVLAKKL